MKKGLTELVFILDRSGSMSGLESDTIGGYNSMLRKQKETDGECIITTALFDNTYTLLHDRIDLKAVNPMTPREYSVGGSTALLDAVGTTIQKIRNAQEHTASDFQAEKVLFVIITDGEENSSREYTAEQIRQLIDVQKNEFKWEFIYLGANIDAVSAAGKIGIHADRVQNYQPDSEGVRLNFTVMSEAVTAYRISEALPDDWDEEIRKDFEKRGKKH